MPCAATGYEQINKYRKEMIKVQMTVGLFDEGNQQEVKAKNKDLHTFQTSILSLKHKTREEIKKNVAGSWLDHQM